MAVFMLIEDNKKQPQRFRDCRL